MDSDVSRTTKPTEQASDAGAPTRATPVDGWEAQRRDIKLGFLIHDVSRMRRKAFEQLIRPLGITRAQWWVLANLARQDGMTQVQLADILEVGKASLGALIERLEAGKWLERRGDPLDKRANRVYLTRNAKPLLERMRTAERVFNERVMASLSADDRAELVRLLSLIKRSLSNIDLGGARGAS